MREHLLGYLLGALDAAEHEAVELALKSDSQLQEELSVLRQRIAPLDAAVHDYDPPPGLAARTCARIAEPTKVSVAGLGIGSTRFHPDVVTPIARAKWSMADWIVAAGVVAAGAILFLPVIAQSHEVARVLACQDKLQKLGTALISYSDLNENRLFPAVPSEGNDSFAGIVPVTLHDCGLLPDGSLLVCPGSELAEHPEAFRIPTRQEIMAAQERQLVRLRQRAGGSYGYNLGVMDNKQHRPARNQGRSCFALVADAPSSYEPARTSNHGGRGQNVLYEDGHVVFVVDFPTDAYIDHPYRNRHGQMEAGVDNDDAVIGSSQTSPFIRYVNFSLGR